MTQLSRAVGPRLIKVLHLQAVITETDHTVTSDKESTPRGAGVPDPLISSRKFEKKKTL